MMVTPSLSWFRGSEMMDSHYSVEGDTVSAIITFVPSHTDQVTVLPLCRVQSVS